jgi:hypothetical protein
MSLEFVGEKMIVTILLRLRCHNLEDEKEIGL